VSGVWLLFIYCGLFYGKGLCWIWLILISRDFRRVSDGDISFLYYCLFCLLGFGLDWIFLLSSLFLLIMFSYFLLLLHF